MSGTTFVLLVPLVEGVNLCSRFLYSRDSFANVVDLLDDMFERAAAADEPIDMNFVKKHAQELSADGVDRPAARLFSNPPGDYGSMVNEVVGNGSWEESSSLGETWKSRNVFSYGRNEGDSTKSGTARPEVLDKLLETTERIVQEIDSVEYGLTDIQEYYANTGALKKAAKNVSRMFWPRPAPLKPSHQRPLQRLNPSCALLANGRKRAKRVNATGQFPPILDAWEIHRQTTTSRGSRPLEPLMMPCETPHMISTGYTVCLE